MKIQSLLNKIKDLNDHRTIATRQSRAYDHAKKNLTAGTIMIDLDWKQKVLIGKKTI